MTLTIDELIKKHGLGNFDKPLTLDKDEKLNLLSDLEKIKETFSRILDILIFPKTPKESQILLALSYLSSSSHFVYKNKISEAIGYGKRTDSLKNEFDSLEKSGFIEINKVHTNLHEVKLLENNFSDLHFLKEIVQKYWKPKNTEIESIKEWKEKEKKKE